MEIDFLALSLDEYIMDVWNNFSTLKSLETRPIDGLSLGVAKGEFKSSHMID